MNNKLRAFLLYIIIGVAATAAAQRSGMGKLSPWLRQLVRQEQSAACPSRMMVGQGSAHSPNQDRQVCALVRVSDPHADVLGAYDSRSMAQFGHIHIASIPVSRLTSLASDPRVSRIEARPMGNIQTDSVARQLNVIPVHQGKDLPQAFTGKGVVVGVMDIGFDLTHPNFYSRDTTCYRIARLWDMLATDTLGSGLYVGRDYAGRDSLLALGHSRDALDQSHGSHTLGIAAGSGYNSPYQGMAPESDICLVANAVGDNAGLIDPSLYDRYTFATDALGFKYIFDYAQSINEPCVISFSEGSPQDFWGYDLLYEELLNQLLGPGRIIVSAAGNYGHMKSWFRKEPGVDSMGTFLQTWHTKSCTLKSPDDFTLRLVAYQSSKNDTLLITTREILASPDSFLTTRIAGVDSMAIEAYPSCYHPEETCYDLTLYTSGSIGFAIPLSLEVLGTEADVELWRGSVVLTVNALNLSLNAGECVRSVLSPASYSRIVCVGATAYREGITNWQGDWQSAPGSEVKGGRGNYSSVGPTMDGRIKPDVMAPGSNIISSYNSFYLENHPDASDIGQWDVERFPFNGRTYEWTSNAGTSMACPAVAGIIALWLQAKPTLTPEDVLDVMAHTCHQPATLAQPTEPASKNNECGYGEINAYRGLLYLLGLDQISDLSAHHTDAHVTIASRQLRVSLPAPPCHPLTVRLYSLSGQMVTVFTGSDLQQQTFPLPHLPAGVYAVQLEGASVGSTLVRIH